MTDNFDHREVIKDGAMGKASFQIDWNDVPDDDLVSFIKTQHDGGKSRKLSWEANAAVNLAYMRGDQHLEWNRDQRALAERMIDVGVPDNIRQRVSINTIKGFVLHRMSLLLGPGVTWNVQPWSGEDEDINSARIGSKLLQHLWGGADATFDERLATALWVMFGTGVVFAKIVWDQSAGPVKTFSPTSKDDTNGDGKSRFSKFADRVGRGLGRGGDVGLTSAGTFRTGEGEVRVDFVSGFEITEPAFAKTMDQCEWILQSHFQSKFSLMERYGSKANAVVPDVSSESYRIAERNMYGRYGSENESGQTGNVPAEQVLVHELWRRKSRNNNKGHRSVVSDDGIVLVNGPNPYKDGDLPFARFVELPEDRFRPASSVGMLIELQDARNRHRTQFATHMNRAMDPHILHEQTAGLPEDAFTTGPSKTMVNEGGIDKIRPMAPPALPAHAVNLDAMYARDMEDVVGVHPSSLGKSEGGQQSGKHAQLLQQSDQRGNQVTRLLVERGLRYVGQLALSRYHQFAKSERVIRVAGEHMEYEAIRFTGKQLGPKGSETAAIQSWTIRVKIGVDPDLPQLMDRLVRAVELGILDPQNNSKDRMMMEQFLGDEIVRDDRSSEHRARADQENAEMLLDAGKGDVEIILARGDDDRIHIAEHEKFTTTSRFRDGVRKKPHLAIVVEDHTRAHLYALKEKELRPTYIERATTFALEQEYANVPKLASVGDSPAAAPGVPAGGPQAPAAGVDPALLQAAGAQQIPQGAPQSTATPPGI